MPTYQVKRFNNGSMAGPHYSTSATPPMLNRNGSVDVSSVITSSTQLAKSLSHRMPYLKSNLDNLFVPSTGSPSRLLEFRAVDWGKAATDSYECDDLEFGLSYSRDGGTTYNSMFSGSVSDEDVTGQGMLVFYMYLLQGDRLKVNVNIDSNYSANPLVNCIFNDLDSKWKIMETSYQTSSVDDEADRYLLHRWQVRGGTVQPFFTVAFSGQVNYFGMWNDLFDSQSYYDNVFTVGS